MSMSEQIIKLVKKNRILYDVSHSDYKNSKKKDKIWDQIGKELDLQGEIVKVKWKNLRDTYVKYLRSIRTKNPQTHNRLKRWAWANQMQDFRPFFIAANPSEDVKDGKIVQATASGETTTFVCNRPIKKEKGLDTSPTKSSYKLKQQQPTYDVAMSEDNHIFPDRAGSESNDLNPLETQSQDDLMNGSNMQQEGNNLQFLLKRFQPSLDDSAILMGLSWAVQYSELMDDQKPLVRKLINDALFDGAMGRLYRPASVNGPDYALTTTDEIRYIKDPTNTY